MADIMEALKNGLVFYVFGFIFVFLYDGVQHSFNHSFVVHEGGNIIAQTIYHTTDIPTMVFLAIPFFLMGFISKYLE